MRHRFVVAVGSNAHLADRQPLAELDQMRVGDEIARAPAFSGN